MRVIEKDSRPCVSIKQCKGGDIIQLMNGEYAMILLNSTSLDFYEVAFLKDGSTKSFAGTLGVKIVEGSFVKEN